MKCVDFTPCFYQNVGAAQLREPGYWRSLNRDPAVSGGGDVFA
jgi:hypothetical protein